MSFALARKERPPVIVITGPTAAGKSALAIALARRFDGEIVNADSMQVYRYLDIGTAKPTAEERLQAPHHLLDVVAPNVAYNAGRYASEARACARRIHERGRPVLLTGGTGLYIRAFLEGLLCDEGADAELRKRLEQEHESARDVGDPERLHRHLCELDPAAGAAIHPHDVRRIIRALELSQRSGRPVSSLRKAHGFSDRPYRTLHLALDPGREALRQRIDLRCERMIEQGLLQETRRLRDRGYGPELRPLQAIGYRHMHPVIDGIDTLANALTAMQRDTRHFARRQRTWLRAIPEVVWMHPEDRAGLVKSVEAFLESGVPRGREALQVQ
jgi:tRNA dimethylallyltransferase